MRDYLLPPIQKLAITKESKLTLMLPLPVALGIIGNVTSSNNSYKISISALPIHPWTMMMIRRTWQS